MSVKLTTVDVTNTRTASTPTEASSAAAGPDSKATDYVAGVSALSSFQTSIIAASRGYCIHASCLFVGSFGWLVRSFVALVVISSKLFKSDSHESWRRMFSICAK